MTVLIFSVSTAAVVQVAYTRGGSDGAPMATGDLYPGAASLAAQIVETPGTGWYRHGCVGDASGLPVLGEFAPHEVTRFGLAVDPCGDPRPSRLVSFDKVHSLRAYSPDDAPDPGRLDYPRLKAALGLPEHRDFRLETEPVRFAAAADGGPQPGDPHLRILYVGAWSAEGDDDFGPKESVVPEARYLERLAQPFRAAVMDPAYATDDLPYHETGPILPDRRQTLQTLPSILLGPDGAPTYARANVLVAGSHVNHGATDDPAVPAAVETWVRAGGLLILLGSDPQPIAWLGGLLEAALEDAVGELEVLETQHPSLNGLAVGRRMAELHDFGQAWRVGPDHEAHFVPLAQRGAAVLSVSVDGGFDRGRVALSSFRPYSPQGEGAVGDCDPDLLSGQCLGLQTLANYLRLAYEDVHLAVGPPVPQDRPSAAASRVATVDHPTLGLVDLRIRVHHF